MTTKSELQDLLRFLTQDAKLPLKEAMGKVTALQQAKLRTPESISAAPITTLSPILDSTPASKTARQVLTAAKRITKKRIISATSPTSTAISSKRTKPNPAASNSIELSSAELESSLLLPTCDLSLEDLQPVVVTTNRAPLLLAFAFVLLAYTHPHQPLSSRLSLAQAVVSANSRAKAVNIGLESGNSAEEDGWGAVQPRVRIMGREIRVLKRWGYEPTATKVEEGSEVAKVADEMESMNEGKGMQEKRAELDISSYDLDANEAAAAQASAEGTLLGDEQSQAISNSTRAGDDGTITDSSVNVDCHSSSKKPLQDSRSLTQHPTPQIEATVPLWALDTEALHKSKTTKQSSAAHFQVSSAFATSNLPIHTPQAARAYLLKSFSTSEDIDVSISPSRSKKRTAKEEAEERERNCGMVLAAIDALLASWIKTVSREELEKRAWAWYVTTRPVVERGQKGWGERGRIELRKILDLRK